MMARRILALVLLAAIGSVFQIVPAFAQQFPSKTVHIVVPYAAGGSVDVLARALAQGLSSVWGHSVIVDNVTGAGSIIAAEKVANASPDGHTLLLTIDPTVVGNRFLYKKLPYDPDKSLAPITMIAQSGLFVIVHPSVAANTFHELVELARREPGKIAYASSGVGTSQHLMFEAISKREGVNFLHVTYKGIAPAITAVVSGEVQVSGASAAAAGSMIRAGRVRALAVGGNHRSSVFPNVPTLAEAGYPYVALGVWFGLFAPGGVNPQLTQRIYRDVMTVVKNPQFKEKYVAAQGLELVANTPEEFTAAINADVAITAGMVKAAGLKPQ